MGGRMDPSPRVWMQGRVGRVLMGAREVMEGGGGSLRHSNSRLDAREGETAPQLVFVHEGGGVLGGQNDPPARVRTRGPSGRCRVETTLRLAFEGEGGRGGGCGGRRTVESRNAPLARIWMRGRVSSSVSLSKRPSSSRLDAREGAGAVGGEKAAGGGE
jgi:hypothetical protein